MLTCQCTYYQFIFLLSSSYCYLITVSARQGLIFCFSLLTGNCFFPDVMYLIREIYNPTSYIDKRGKGRRRVVPGRASVA